MNDRDQLTLARGFLIGLRDSTLHRTPSCDCGRMAGEILKAMEGEGWSGLSGAALRWSSRIPGDDSA